MNEELKIYIEKSKELRIQSMQLIRHYTNPKSTAKEFHDQRQKVSQLAQEHYKIEKQIEQYL